MLLAKIEVGLMAALPGGDVAMRYPEEADMPMTAIVQTLHQHVHRAVVVVADGGESRRVAGQQHHRFPPRRQHLFANAGKAKQYHAVDIAAGEDPGARRPARERTGFPS